MKISELQLFESGRGEKPVFLLDDIDTELDILRIQRMIKYTDEELQIFITTTKPQLIENTGKEVFLIEIEGGDVKNLKKIN
ncbi:MAG: hypothetical protein JW737_04095 [Acidobacteria bacterium]|nr:hypothetical protein [Acidobacteriota bacterium]